MQDKVVLLLDTFFYIAVWKGQQVADWERAGYHDQPEYANLKALLEVPIEDAEYIMADRFPMPRFFVAVPGDSNERKIKVRVNPSKLSAENGSVDSGQYFTEDVSLGVFMQHLVKMAMSSRLPEVF